MNRIEYPIRDMPLEVPAFIYCPEIFYLRDEVYLLFEGKKRDFVKRFMKKLYKKNWHFALLPVSGRSFNLIHLSYGLLISLQQWKVLHAIAKEEARKIQYKTLQKMNEKKPYHFVV